MFFGVLTGVGPPFWGLLKQKLRMNRRLPPFTYYETQPLLLYFAFFSNTKLVAQFAAGTACVFLFRASFPLNGKNGHH